MESLLSKHQAIELGKKALKDIGHWEDFKIENARFLNDNDPFHNFDHWMVWFNFTDNDWNNGEVTPMLIINDEIAEVVNASWKKSVFPLFYDKENDKYYHRTLSREQRKF
jgi:hypothetical protein